MTNTTRFDVRVGSVIRCNDPRYGWEVTVERVTPDRVYFHRPGGHRWLSLRFDRLFLDGKARHQGYNLVRA